jgi:hypothetical protein
MHSHRLIAKSGLHLGLMRGGRAPAESCPDSLVALGHARVGIGGQSLRWEQRASLESRHVYDAAHRSHHAHDPGALACLSHGPELIGPLPHCDVPVILALVEAGLTGSSTERAAQ